MPFTLDGLFKRLATANVETLFVKRLAPNDNSKNQIYLGSDLGLLNFLPFGKPVSEQGNRGARLKAPLSLDWLEPDGRLVHAPATQLILYPQYPEVRLSGFLKGAATQHASLMRSREPGRILVLGVSGLGSIVAFAIGPETDLAQRISMLKPIGLVGPLLRLRANLKDTTPDSKEILVSELSRIYAADWIKSKRLSSGGILLNCDSPNCGGYTLEAELGIIPNGFSEPDFHGWELKQRTVPNFLKPTNGPITLMTPEPTGGYYKDAGVAAFVRRFGYEDRMGRSDRLNFGGIHKVGIKHKITHLRMEIEGFDNNDRRIVDPSGGVVLLAGNDEIAAKWSFADLIAHWRRKHAQAAFVLSERSKRPFMRYRYGPHISFGEGTDVIRFLNALSSGTIYYDPGIKLEGVSSLRPRQKRRSQFRINSSNISDLYTRFESVDLSKHGS